MKNTSGMRTKYNVGRNRARRSHEQGTSLIEIMVVLVIILIGLFLVMRVFPIGFGVLRANADRNTATQLAENMMSLVKADASTMPDGVLFAITDNQDAPNGLTPLKFKTDINPDNLGPCYIDTTGNNPCSENSSLEDPGNAYFADVNKFRFIKGEAVKIPAPTPTAYGTGSVYIVKFGPIFMDPTVGDPTKVPTDAAGLALFNSFFHVYGAPLNGQMVEAPRNGQTTNSQGQDVNTLASLLQDEQSYLIDYGDGTTGAQILILPRATTTPARANPSRTFSVTLTYQENGQIVTKTVDPVVVNDGTPAAFQPITVGGLAVNGAVPGSEIVVRDFTRIGSTTNFDPSDPYQYKFVSNNIATGETEGPANFGIIAFNPAGASASSTGTSSQQAFTAYLDYAVLDWHIIRDDRQVPSVLTGPGNTIPLRTTLQLIKRIGDPETDNSFYGGIYGNTASPNTEANPKDFQVFSMDTGTGQPLVGGNYNNGNPAPAGADYYLNYDQKGGSYRTGVVYINAARVKPGTRIRMLYKAVGDWAVSFQKAYARYTPAYDSTGAIAKLPLPGSYDHYAQLKTFNGGKVAGAQLRFPYSDFNKSVVVTLQYTVNGEVKRLSPTKITLDKFDVDKTADPKVSDQRFAYANVRDALPLLQQADFDNATDWQVVGPVLGVSVKTRVIWHDNDAPNERWRVQDLDSYATVSATR